MKVNQMKKKALLLFDMDGVLVDVSKSYRDTVRQTARLFLQEACGSASLPNPLFSLADLAAVKQSGGLNNDWDLTRTVLDLLFTKVGCPEIHDSTDPWTRYAGTMEKCDVSDLARHLESISEPLAALLDARNRPANPFIGAMYEGDVGSGNVIKQIFQELYLGKGLFDTTYGFPPAVYHGEGFIDRESLLIGPEILETLSKTGILAIATGRPRAEADYPLDHFHIRRFFSAIYALDDCIGEEQKVLRKTGKTVSLSKPHPFMLDAVADKMRGRFSECYYIGDMPDDMIAAGRSAAGFIGIGFAASSPDKARLTEDLTAAGARRVVDNPSELTNLTPDH